MLKAFQSPFIKMRKQGVKPTDIPQDLAATMFTNPFKAAHEDIFNIKGPFDFKISKGKGCFNIVLCEKCGDAVAENYIKVENNEKICIDCWTFK